MARLIREPSVNHFLADVKPDDGDTAAIGSKILNSHSRRWRILNLIAAARTFRRFSGFIQPNQFVDLSLVLDSPLTSINVRWDNITHLTHLSISTAECIDVLRRAPGLEYLSIS